MKYLYFSGLGGNEMISVVLPVYNGEDSLKKSIDSVLQQTYTDFELIIVNDCSKDNTAQIIEEAIRRDSRIRCITNKINQKLPGSLNIGFAEARGEYFTWTSHDNMYHKDALKVMVNELEKDNHIGMVYCDFLMIDINDNEIAVCSQDTPETLAWKNPVGACFLYRRELAEEIGEYDTELFLAEDYEYWLRIWEKSKIVHIPQVLYYYRKHEKSLTETRKVEIGYKTVQVWFKHWQYVFSHIYGIKNKLQFCYKMVEMGDHSQDRNIFVKIVKGYPLFLIYYPIKKLFINKRSDI